MPSTSSLPNGSSHNVTSAAPSSRVSTSTSAGHFRSRCEIRRQVGDPADAGLEDAPCFFGFDDIRMLAQVFGKPQAMWREIGDRRQVERVEGKHRAHLRRPPNLAREFHQRPQFGGAPWPPCGRSQIGEAHEDVVLVDQGRAESADTTICFGVARLAEVIGRRSGVAAPDIAPQLRPRAAGSVSGGGVIVADVVDQQLLCHSFAEGDGNRLFLGVRQLQPASIDQVEIRQAVDETREATRVVGLRRFAGFPIEVQFQLAH